MKSLLNNKWLFALLLAIVSLIYSYPGILKLRPQGVHQWRQTDCLSITTNFYERDMNFFEPEIHCLISDDLTTGKTIGECPITYYFMASVWKVFGKHEWMYRLFTMLLFLTGIFHFYKSLRLIHIDQFWNSLLAISIFTAPLLVYYGSGFLSDIHAFSFVLISSFYFLRYGINHKKSDLLFAVLFIVIAGLLKITAFILFLTLVGLFILEIFGVELWPKHQVFRHRGMFIMLGLLAVIIVASWYVYAEQFNKIHGGKYTFNDIWPFWKATAHRLKEIVERFRAVLIYQVFSKPWMYALLLMFIVLLSNIRKLPKLISIGLVILTFGCAAYGALWFEAFDIHDYYLTNLYILPVAIISSFYFILVHQWSVYLESRQVKICVTLLIIWGIGYTAQNMNMRFYPKESNPYLMTGSQDEVNLYKYTKWAYNQQTQCLETIEPYLESIGVMKDDLVITQPDASFNINLYLMNRRGWSSMGNDSNTPEGIQKRINHGAKFLIVTIDNTEDQTPHLKSFLSYPIGDYKNAKIYDLRPYHNSPLSN